MARRVAEAPGTILHGFTSMAELLAVNRDLALVNILRSSTRSLGTRFWKLYTVARTLIDYVVRV